MNREKWLRGEIDSWYKEGLIDNSTAAALNSRYPEAKGTNRIVVLFSIIGALLIGVGVILIAAKNWSRFPMNVRIVISFAPLVISQALALYTVKAKGDSLAWREPVAILVTASVFTAVALVGQLFHLANDYATYVLTCALLSMPIMFILDAMAPLIVYYWAILTWATYQQWLPGSNSILYAIALLALFTIGVLFVATRKKASNPRLLYMTWVTTLASFPLMLYITLMIEGDLLTVLMGLFVLLLAVEGLPEQALAPCRIIGTAGALITSAVYTFESTWYYTSYTLPVAGIVLAITMLALPLLFAPKVFTQDKPRFALILLLSALNLVGFLGSVGNFDIYKYSFQLMLLANAVVSAIGISYIIFGVKHSSLTRTNVGMATVCILILIRFFDSDLDFLWRGIVFLLLGATFLFVNTRIMRSKKQANKEDSL
ncbi:MAG: DUF2157 domain-containing protein [Coriobacteriia bacterium]|nr:DUF2157 domain-containing protein [Coriobacteriia bacterium]